MLTGHPPFQGDSVREVLRGHLYEQPIPPSAIVGPEACPHLFEQVLLRALAKNADDRFADLADMEAALCEAQIDMGLHTAWDDLPPPEDIDPERRAWIIENMPHLEVVTARKKWMLPIVAATALLVGGGIAYGLADTGPAEIGTRLPDFIRDCKRIYLSPREQGLWQYKIIF